jgi:nitronate monooxygenase
MYSGDPDNTGVWVGEATGLIHDVRPAGDLLRKIVNDAERLLEGNARMQKVHSLDHRNI